MRIAVNALFLRLERVGGSEIALRGLVEGLGRVAPADSIRVYVAAREMEPGLLGERVEVVVAPVPARPRVARVWGEQTWLPMRLARDGADVLWNAGFTAPLWAPVPQVTTVFDAQHLRHPENFRPIHRLAWRVLVDVAMARSRLVVCPSAAALADLTALRPRLQSRLRVIPLGVEPRWLAPQDDAGLDGWRVRAGLDAPFVLCVGTTHPHKGHGTLLSAWRTMLDSGLSPPLLVLTGVRGLVDAELGARVERLGLGNYVRHLGWVPRDDLARAYRAAVLTVLPSRFEGFGLPLLEALALGSPVVASDLPVFREIAGDAARWVSERHGGAWAAVLTEELAEPHAARARVERGRRMAANFTWDRSASMLRELFAEAAPPSSVSVWSVRRRAP